jgi:hypothetical protein
MGTNFVEAQSMVGDLLVKRENIMKKIAETIAEACAERGAREQYSEALVNDINNILVGMSADEKVKILEYSLLYLIKIGSFSGTGKKKSNSRDRDDYGDLFSKW